MADRYLVATANWSSTDAWSATSGGAAGASVPTSSDNVYCDANSGAVTLTISSTAVCNDLVCTGFTGTITQTSGLELYGATITLGAGMTLDCSIIGSWQFYATSGTQVFTSAAQEIGQFYTVGSGGTVQLADALTVKSSLYRLYGTFDPNGNKVTCTNTSALYISGFSGSSAFYDLDFTPATGGAGRKLVLSSDITVTNDLTLDSNSTDARYRLYVYSDTVGTARTITVGGTVSASYVDFEDITGAGAASWDISAATGGSGDCGGNSGITFTTAATSYMVGSGTRDFYNAPWASSSGGTAGTGRVPLPQDTGALDANTGTGSIYQSLYRAPSMDFSGFTGTLVPSASISVYGSITLSSGMTLGTNTNTWTFKGRGSHTLTSAGKTWAKSLIVDAYGGTLTLGDDLELNNGRQLTVTRGTFDANDFDVTTVLFNSSNSNTRTIRMGSGTWEITGTTDTYLWTTSNTTGLTFDAETSTLMFSGAVSGDRYFQTGGLTFHDVVNATTGASGVIFRDSFTANSITVSPGATQRCFAGHTVTATTWVLTGTSGSPITIASNTTSAFTIAKAGGGTVVADYATISYSTASPASTFSATNSTDGGNNTNWTFVAGSTYTPRLMMVT